LKEQKLDARAYADEKIVDKFVERFYAGEYKLKPEADKIMFTEDDGKQGALRPLLGEAIANYMTSRSNLIQICKLMDNGNVGINQGFLDACKLNNAWRSRCLKLITHAKNLDLVVETECLSSKLEKLQQEHEALKEEHLKLKKRNKELERFSKNFPTNQRDGTEYGDVQGT
jgi:hypothetical protein